MKYRIQIVLKDTLRRWELGELSKPVNDRRAVPNLTNIADGTAYSRNAISNLANDNRVNVDLQIVAAVVKQPDVREVEALLDAEIHEALSELMR